eukprot:648000-Rhodomonas_salina.1
MDISVTSNPGAGFTNDPDKVVLLTSLAAQRSTTSSPLSATTVPLLPPEPAAASAPPANEPFLGEVVEESPGEHVSDTPFLDMLNSTAVEGTLVDSGMGAADGAAAVSSGLEAYAQVEQETRASAPVSMFDVEVEQETRASAPVSMPDVEVEQKTRASAPVSMPEASEVSDADVEAAVSRGVEAYGDVEQKARARFPLSMSEAVAQHKAAAEAARAAFEQALEESGGAGEAEKHKITLESAICQWRHPGKGAAVVEITDGIARLVKRDEAVGGCGAKL